MFGTSGCKKIAGSPNSNSTETLYLLLRQITTQIWWKKLVERVSYLSLCVRLFGFFKSAISCKVKIFMFMIWVDSIMWVQWNFSPNCTLSVWFSPFISYTFRPVPKDTSNSFEDARRICLQKIYRRNYKWKISNCKICKFVFTFFTHYRTFDIKM